VEATARHRNSNRRIKKATSVNLESHSTRSELLLEWEVSRRSQYPAVRKIGKHSMWNREEGWLLLW
jgi:hypothetical protein